MVKSYPDSVSQNKQYKYLFDTVLKVLVDNLDIEVGSCTEDIMEIVNLEYDEKIFDYSNNMDFFIFKYNSLQHMTENRQKASILKSNIDLCRFYIMKVYFD